jgi:hypothetical protein
MSPKPDRDEVLTVDDLDLFDVDLEHGTSTILRIYDPQALDSFLATVDENGYIRSLDDRRRVVSVAWPADVKVVE